MKKTIRYVDEDTLEIIEKVVDDGIECVDTDIDDMMTLFRQALGCDPDEFATKYNDFKKAKAEFDEIYEPFKKNLIELHKANSGLPKSIVIGGVKATYVSPSTRSTIDSKKLKEEEPELAKKFTKTSKVSASIRLEEI